jgi:REP element-mobilizing transposase RayT
MQKLEPLQPSKYYHIYNRGNNRENLFIEEKNYSYFLDLWQKHVAPVADTFAFCLMKNHFHFLVRIKEDEEIIKLIASSNPNRALHTSQQALLGLTNQEEILKRIKNNFSNHFNAYAQGINKAYNRTGKLFELPFERKVVDSETYFKKLIYYIHFNPQKHGFVKDFREWPYSSYNTFIGDRPTKLKREKAMEWFIDKSDFVSSQQIAPNFKDIEKLIEGD